MDHHVLMPVRCQSDSRDANDRVSTIYKVRLGLIPVSTGSLVLAEVLSLTYPIDGKTSMSILGLKDLHGILETSKLIDVESRA